MAFRLADLLVGLDEAAVDWAGDGIGDVDQRGTDADNRNSYSKEG